MDSLTEMKRHRVSFRKGLAVGIALFTLGFFFHTAVSAQFLLTENFVGSSGSSISVSGWTEQCGTSGSSILISDGGLTYAVSGFAGSGIGNAAEFSGLDGTAQRTFSSQSLPVYMSFLIEVQNATSGTGALTCGSGTMNIINFLNNGGGTTNRENGLVIQSSGGGFIFGVDGNATVYAPGVYNFNETYLLVLKARNGGVDLYINPTLGASEPVADVQTSWAGSPPSNVQGVNISESGFGIFELDAIKVSAGWSNVTALQEPTAQPANLAFTNVLPNSLDASFDDAVSTYGTPSYIVIRKAGSYSTDLPVDGTSYSAGNTIGTGTVVHVGGNTFQDSGLDPATTYYYSVYSFYSDDPSYDYYTTGPLQLSVTTLWNEPTVQTSGLVVSARDEASVSFDVTAGNGTHQMIVMRKSSAIEALPSDGEIYTGTFQYGTGSEIGSGNFVIGVGGPDWSWSTGNLEPETQYFIRSFALNDNAFDNHTTGLVNFLTDEASGNPISFTTLALPPSVQASAISFTAVDDIAMTLDFTGGDGSSTLVVARQGAAVDSQPADGVAYTPNNIFGNGTEIGSGNFVVGAGPGPITVSGLSPGTSYHFALYAFNGSGATANYLTTGTDNTVSRSTLFSEPTIQTSNLAVTLRGTNTVSFTGTSGNGSHDMVVFKNGGSVDALPADGTVYSGTYSYGDGSELGTGNFVVAVNEAGISGLTIGSLQPETQYFIRSFALNDNTTTNVTSNVSNFLTTEADSNPISFYTFALEPAGQPQNLEFSSVTNSSFTATFTPPIDPPDGYLALMSANLAPDFVPVDGESYTLNQVVGTVGGNNIYAVHSGSASTFNLENLSAEETLYFRVYAFNGTGETINYLTADPLSGSQITLAAPPTVQASALDFTAVNTTSLTFTFANGDGASRIVVGRESTETASDPVDGVAYSANAEFGLGSLIGTGSYVVGFGLSPHTITGLSPGTSYTFQVYELNGDASTINYLQSAPLTGSQSTMSAEPLSQASGITVDAYDDSSVTLTFTNGDGTSRLIVGREGSAIDADPVDGTTYSGSATFGSGTEIGSGNFVVGIGSGPVTVSGLGAGPYHFRIYEFNGAGGTENYLTATAAGNPVSVRNTWHVSTGGSDGNNGSPTLPLRSIQTALTMASAGDVIKVGAGTYDEGLITQAKVVMMGGYTNTFLDAGRDIFANKTVVRAVSTVIVNDAHGCTIDGFIFDGNNVAETGLDISSSSVITHNVVLRCTQSPGQGIDLSGNASVVNNVIHANTRGILIFGGTSASATVRNNIITGHSFGLNNSSAAGIHRYNDVYDNAFNYTGNFNSPGVGDISLNPLYINEAGEDFRLQPGSPAIDRGDPADPVGDEPVYNGSRINMGAYGGTGNATPTNPVIESFTPTEGAVGTTVTISGFNFSANAASNIVQFNGVGATVEASSTTSITTSVPPGATDGPITVEVNGGTGTSVTDFKIIPPPVIVSFDPAMGEILTLVTITGSGFDPIADNNVVFFGAVRAQVTTASESSLAVIVPPGATYDLISVTANGLTGWSRAPFTPVSQHVGSITETFFESAVDVTAGNAPFAPAASDLDGDGKPDIINVNANDNTLSLLKNNYDGTSFTASSFGSPVNFTTGGNPRSSAASDLNGDGRPDIVVGNLNGSSISIFENAASPGVIDGGTLTAEEKATEIQPDNVRIADLDQDGRPEIIFSSGSTVSDAKVTVLKNGAVAGAISADAFTAAIELAPGQNVTDVEIHDLDLDGKPEIIVATTGNHMYIYRNVASAGILGNSSFLSPVDIATMDYNSDLAVGDIDGDGLPELVACNALIHTISVFENDIAGGVIEQISFNNRQDFPVGESPEYCKLADLNGDGKPEVVVLNYNDPTVSVFQNNSSAGTITGTSLAGQQTFAIPQNSYGLAVADVDGDGASDILISSGTTVSVLRNALSTATPAPVISDFNPKQGAVGTEVTIDGENFGTNPIVKFNGVVAALISNSTVQIVATVPAGATDGVITVEVDGRIASGSSPFTVTPSPPVITSFTPTEGPVGTEVTITGENFSGRLVSVEFNTIAATIISNTGTQIVAGVPAGATNGVITVKVDEMETSSSTEFIVTATPPAPVITAFTPTEGPPGTEVTIDGENFSGTGLAVLFNGMAATILSGNSTTIVAVVPASATDGVITVEVNAQNVSSTTIFTVTVPVTPAPVISSFTPTEGPVGTNVEINGENFGDSPVVRFNNVEAVVSGSTPGQIQTVVPAGATSGYITVRAGTITAVSPAIFTVIPTPTISSFTPARAAVGEEVTISGLHFDPVASGNAVAFNGVAATDVVSASAESLVVVVPAAATKGKITVTVNGRSGMSSTDFVVVPSIVSNDFVSTYDRGTSVTVSFTVDNAANVKSAALKLRGISEPLSAEEEISVTAEGNTYQVTIPATQLGDPVGVEYFANVIDHADVAIAGNRTKAFLRYPSGSTEQEMPGLSFGNKVSNYQIIAVPLNLASPAVTSVFSALGAYNRKFWRLFDYANATREYPAFSTVVPGKGYWLIVRNAAAINPGEGTTVQVNSNNAFEITLVPGWNLIGNPFNFSISWAEILAFNDDPEGVGSLKGFAGGVLGEIDVLSRYRGGFVFSSSAVTLQIPALRNTSLGGRAGSVLDVSGPLDSDSWQLPLFLSDGGLSNALGGIGMHPEASLVGKDRFDEVSVPLPEGLDLFEIRFPHPEFAAFFNKEVVPPVEEYTWEFEINRPSDVENLRMTWKNDFFGNNEKELVLFDPASLETVDMRLTTSYTLSSNSRKLRILYGSGEYIRTSLEDQLPWLGKAYPNPSGEAITIPFRVPQDRGHLPVTIAIYNSSGVEVARLVDGILKAGTHELTWQPDKGSGLFVLRMQLGSESKSVKLLFH